MTFTESIKQLSYPNRILDRKIVSTYNTMYNFSSESECSKFSIPKSVINTFKIIAGISDELLIETIHVPNTNSWKYYKNERILVFFILFSYYMINKNQKLALITLYLLAMQTYGSLMVKYFQSCDENFMSGALSLLRSSSAAKKYGTIGFPIVISNRIFERYKSQFLDKLNDPDFRLRFLSELRHRLNQAIKNLARKYYQYYNMYKNKEIGKEQVKSSDSIYNAISSIMNNIIITGDVDQSVITKLSKYYGINSKIAIDISNKLISDGNTIKQVLIMLGNILGGNIDEVKQMDLNQLVKFIYKNKKLYSKIKTLFENSAVLNIRDWKKFPRYIRDKSISIFVIYLLYLLKTSI